MSKTKRFVSAFEYLRYNHAFSSQTEAANISGLSRSNISSAINGNEDILTDKFFQRFNNAFGNVFNLQWLLTGEGSMLKTQSEEAQPEPQPQPQPQPNIEEGRDALVLQLMAIIREQAEEIGRLKAKCGE